MPHRVIKSIDGRRGGALAIIAATFIALGWGMLRARPDGRSRVMSWLPDWFGDDDLGLVIVTLATAALICALMSRWSKWALPVGFGFVMLAAASLAAIHGVAAAFALTHDWSLMVVFLCFTALIFNISGWDESRPHPPMSSAQRQVLTSPPIEDGDRGAS